MNDKLLALREIDFQITGTIIHGKKLGRQLGYPTANLECPAGKALPQNGVYIAVIDFLTGNYAGESFPCVLNQGLQPTAPSGAVTVEAHIPDFSGDLYGAQARVTYLRFIRPETRFASLDELKAQLLLDTQAACGFFAENHPEGARQ